MIETGNIAPDFTLPDENGEEELYRTASDIKKRFLECFGGESQP